MDDSMFNEIQNRIPPGFDWSIHYQDKYVDSLTNYASLYYEKQQQKIIEGDDSELELFNYDKYRPENCKTKAQKFLIYEHLYYHREWFKYQNGERNGQPKTLCTNVEGKPGTGKTFVTNTLRNMTRLLHNSNSADLASAPTGAAASLINGKTHSRCSSIPIGAAFQKPPTNLNISDPVKLRAMRLAMALVITQVMDEHSMYGRSKWA